MTPRSPGAGLNDSPVGLASWILDDFYAWPQRFFNVERWTEMPKDRHFAATEEPELLAEDIRAFFRSLRDVPQ